MEFIAEIGSSHEGSLDRAIHCIHAAAAAGATATKWQLLRAESLYQNPQEHTRTQQYHLPLEWIPLLSRESHQAGLYFGVSVFALDLVEPLRRVVDFVKIAAYDLPYLSLIEAAAGLGCRVVLSTAMATLPEIAQAVQTVWDVRSALRPLGMTARKGCVTLLHGVACYPAPLCAQNLRALTCLETHFPECQRGLSDHTVDNRVAMIACALGAEMFEVHFRLDDSTQTMPDYSNARTPAQFLRYVQDVYAVREALGRGEKMGPNWYEEPLYAAARRSNDKPLRG